MKSTESFPPPNLAPLHLPSPYHITSHIPHHPPKTRTYFSTHSTLNHVTPQTKISSLFKRPEFRSTTLFNHPSTPYFPPLIRKVLTLFRKNTCSALSPPGCHSVKKLKMPCHTDRPRRLRKERHSIRCHVVSRGAGWARTRKGVFL